MPGANLEEIRRGLRKVLRVLLLSGWFGLLGLTTLLGLFLSGKMVLVSLSLAAGTIGALSIEKWWKRRRLIREGHQSLLARAQADGLVLDRATRDVLRAFDRIYANILGEISDPAFSQPHLAVVAEADIRRVQDHLYQLARTACKLRGDRREMDAMGATQFSAELSIELEADIRALDEEARQLLTDSQRLWQRLSRVRQMAHNPSGSAGERLAEALAEVDRALASFREIDETRLSSARARAERTTERAEH